MCLTSRFTIAACSYSGYKDYYTLRLGYKVQKAKTTSNQRQGRRGTGVIVLSCYFTTRMSNLNRLLVYIEAVLKS